MQTGESISSGFEKHLESLVKKYCDEKDHASKGWKARINKHGAKDGKCQGKRLYDKMKGKKPKKPAGKPYKTAGDWDFRPKAYNPFVKKPKDASEDDKEYKKFQSVKEQGWSLKNISSNCFPVQAHHLIPKNFLPTQGVCAFLAKGYKGKKKYTLMEDTFYSCDHANNGYCLPYATPLAEWKGAKDKDKIKITEEVMDKTQRQLHQGSHRAKPYEDPPDEGWEEPDVHEIAPGYLDTIEQLLKHVQTYATNHVDWCKRCKSSDEKKMQPLEASVRHMDQVSGLVKLMIDFNNIYISKPAYNYFAVTGIPDKAVEKILEGADLSNV